MAPSVVPVSILCSERLFREALRYRLACQTELELVDWAATAWQLARRTRGRAGEMILLVCMGDSTAAVNTVWEVKTVMPRARLVVLGMDQNESEIVLCIEAGASFCLDCRSSWPQLVETILAVWEGRIYGCSPNVLSRVAQRIGELAKARDAAEDTEPVRLTSREREVAGLMCLGLANRQIARRLGTSVATVKTHIHNLMAKTRRMGNSNLPEAAYGCTLSQEGEEGAPTATQGRRHFSHDAQHARKRLSTEGPQ